MPSPFGIAALGHELRQHAMERHAVVEAAFDERDEVGGGLRRFVLEELDDDVALGGLELHARQIVGLGFGGANRLFLRPQLAILVDRAGVVHHEAEQLLVGRILHALRIGEHAVGLGLFEIRFGQVKVVRGEGGEKAPQREPLFIGCRSRRAA